MPVDGRAKVKPDGQKVKERRASLGTTQEELAHRTLYALNTIRNVEAGKDVLIKTLETIADALEVPFQELLHEREDRQDSPQILSEIADFTRYTDEKTRDFVGRHFLFEEIDQFIDQNERGYFVLRGDPGIGKSALMAQLVKARGYLHHFNIRAEGISRAERFLKSMCAQIINAYGLGYEKLPSDAGADSSFLSKLFDEAVRSRGGKEKIVIAIDALDEVDMSGQSEGSNVLYLPKTLPTGVYIIATARREEEERLPLRVEIREYVNRHLEHNEQGNMADITEYLRQQLERPGIAEYIATHLDGDADKFIERMAQLSEGNFMYLYYVIPEIEHGDYHDLDLVELPAGLENYYEDHWQRIQGRDEHAWEKYKLPVLATLAAQQGAVSIDLLTQFTDVPRARLRAVLVEWKEFLHATPTEFDGEVKTVYSLYHKSFFEFICAKDLVQDAGVDLKARHKKISDVMYKKMYPHLGGPSSVQ